MEWQGIPQYLYRITVSDGQYWSDGERGVKRADFSNRKRGITPIGRWEGRNSLTAGQPCVQTTRALLPGGEPRGDGQKDVHGSLFTDHFLNGSEKLLRPERLGDHLELLFLEKARDELV